ncbi:MAG: tRNA preQ1(34) S-adenosylmethionine ribosyltransferase-isomerase QueA [Gemmatimonadales bacterium]
MNVHFRAGDFEYQLPPDRIAQEPPPERTAGRLLVLDRASGAVSHRRFTDLLDLLAPEDVLVVNTTRVIPARLHGTRERGGPAELLLVYEEPGGTWIAMGHPGGKLKPGRRVAIAEDSEVEILEPLGGGLRRLRFVGKLDARATLRKYGAVPLPPYIHRPPRASDRERYQTVFAEHEGSVAAPTAGLHFSRELLDRVAAKGTAIARLRLHVGPGTFKPVEVEELAAHRVLPEPFAISAEAAALINARRAAGGRVWAVGTTVVRTLETVADPRGVVHAGSGETGLFIYPPYQFRVVDRLLTNFHLPRSSLLMLVCAFGGYEPVIRAYSEAIREKYRFYSYGDAMAVI